MREIDITSLFEMEIMEDEDHAGYSHAKRGKEMGGERAGYASGHVREGTCVSRRKITYLMKRRGASCVSTALTVLFSGIK